MHFRKRWKWLRVMRLGGGGGGVGSLLVVGSGGEELEKVEGIMVALGLVTVLRFSLDDFPYFCVCGFGGDTLSDGVG